MTKRLPKNLSFKSLIFIVSISVLIIFSLSFLLQVVLSDFLNIWLAFTLSILIGGIVCYFVVYAIIDYYLRRRIKLIYKMIRLSKKSKRYDDKSTSQDTMARVEMEVSTWIEEQQKEIQSLKDLENYRKNFLGNISHELKTPIFAVQGYVHTLLDGGLHDPTVNKRFLKKAAQNIERLETIVEDLDIIARLEDATLQLEIQSFDLKVLTLEVVEQVEVQAKKRDITIQFKTGADRSFMVQGDREYIRTVLINLIVNSIKYGKEGGRTKIGFYDMDNEILIDITDNGIGIDNKHLKHLFDRFYRVDNSRSRDRGGSGLGLSIVKHIIEAHNQTINVKSKVGHGTTLSFTLEKAR